MHGICFEYDLQDWFEFKIPKTKIAPDFIENTLNNVVDFSLKPTAKLIWIGTTPVVDYFTKSKKGATWEMAKMTFYFKTDTIEISIEKDQADWLLKTLKSVSNQPVLLKDIKMDFESQFEDFELFWFSKPMNSLRNSGLLVNYTGTFTNSIRTKPSSSIFVSVISCKVFANSGFQGVFTFT